MFQYIALLLLALIFIVVLLSVIFGYFGGFQRPNDRKNISHLFVEKGGNVLMPPFELELQLSDQDQQKLKDNGLTISTTLSMEGPHKYRFFARPGGVSLGTHKVDLNKENVAIFDDIWIPKRVFNRVEDYDFHVQVDFKTHSDPPDEDLEDGWRMATYISFWDSHISKAYGKRHVKKVGFKDVLSDVYIEAFDHGQLYEYRHWKQSKKNAYIKGRKVNDFVWWLHQYSGVGKEELDKTFAKAIHKRFYEDCKENDTKVLVNLLGTHQAQWFIERGEFALIHTNFVFENDLKNLEEVTMDLTLKKLDEQNQALFTETYYEASKGDPKIDLEGLSPQQFLDKDKQEIGEAWDDELVHLAYLNDKLIGVLNLRTEIHPQTKMKEGAINYIGLLATYRNKGIGQQLHLFALHQLKALGCENYFGGTEAENASMLKVFEKNQCRLVEKQGEYKVV